MNDVPLPAIELLSGQKLSDFHDRNVWFYSYRLEKESKDFTSNQSEVAFWDCRKWEEPVQITETLSLFILFAKCYYSTVF